MTQQSFSRSTNILQRFTGGSGSQPTLIYRPGILNPWERSNTVRFYGYITDLRAKIDIRSLPESQMPDMDVLTSRIERITSVRDVEWRSARMELDLMLKTSTHPLVPLATVSLLNRDPYYHLNLMGFLTDNGIMMVANDAALYVRIRNVGFGGLLANDEVILFGAAKEEATALPEPAPEISYSQSFAWTVPNESLTLLPANPLRKQLTLTNKGTEPIYLSYGAIATAGQGITLMPLGGSYEINHVNPYKGMISAISEAAGSVLSGLEAV